MGHLRQISGVQQLLD